MDKTPHIDESSGASGQVEPARLTVLEANVDDLSPEILATLPELLINAGALDAWLTPILMKKGRPAHIISALCEPDGVPAVERAIFLNSSTLGVRRYDVQRITAAREWREVEILHGRIRMKIASLGGERINVAPEFDDCRRLAENTGVPLKEIYRMAQVAFEESDS